MENMQNKSSNNLLIEIIILLLVGPTGMILLH